jgi:hypothetical protein
LANLDRYAEESRTGWNGREHAALPYITGTKGEFCRDLKASTCLRAVCVKTNCEPALLCRSVSGLIRVVTALVERSDDGLKCKSSATVKAFSVVKTHTVQIFLSGQNRETAPERFVVSKAGCCSGSGERR